MSYFDDSDIRTHSWIRFRLYARTCTCRQDTYMYSAWISCLAEWQDCMYSIRRVYRNNSVSDGRHFRSRLLSVFLGYRGAFHGQSCATVQRIPPIWLQHYWNSRRYTGPPAESLRVLVSSCRVEEFFEMLPKRRCEGCRLSVETMMNRNETIPPWRKLPLYWFILFVLPGANLQKL